MTRTPLLLTLAAAAALAGCGNSDPIVVGGPADDPANQAPVANGPVELPPSIAASKVYRCRDNSVVYVDWLSDGTANFRAERRDVPVTLAAAEAGEPLVAEGGYSLTGSREASTVTLARPDKGSQSCKA